MNFTDFFQSAFVKNLHETGETRIFKAGDVILNMDAYVHYIPLVLSGSVKVVRTEEDGREILLYYITPGESCIVSILAGFNEEKSKVKAVVEEDAEVLIVSTQKAKEWIRDSPEWMDFIFGLYQKRFEELLNVVNSVAFQKVDVRLLNLLNQKSELYQSKELQVTHQQLADELGITREATSRVLKQMEKDGQILLSRNKITLV